LISSKRNWQIILLILGGQKIQKGEKETHYILLVTSNSIFLSYQISTSQLDIFFSHSKSAPVTSHIESNIRIKMTVG